MEQLEGIPRQRHPGFVVGALIALAVIALPMCDAAHEAELANALAGVGFGSRGGGASALGSYVLWLAIGASIVFAVMRLFEVPGRALPFVVIGVLVAGALVVRSSAKIARRRSHAIDSWSLCEKPGTSAMGFSTYVSPYKRESSFGGPHLPNGDACVEQAEARDEHFAQHPDGNIVDGIRQVMYRFPKDVGRVVAGPGLLLLGLVAALAITIASERRRSYRRSRSPVPGV